MATVEVVTTTCDGCGSEGRTTEHTLKLDRRRRVANDLCDDCRGFVERLAAAGRRR